MAKKNEESGNPISLEGNVEQVGPPRVDSKAGVTQPTIGEGSLLDDGSEIKLAGESGGERLMPQPKSNVAYAVFRRGGLDESAGFHIVEILTEKGNAEIPPGEYGFEAGELRGVFLDLGKDSSWVRHLRGRSDVDLAALVGEVNAGDAQVMRVDADGWDSWYTDLKLAGGLEGRMYKAGKRVQDPDGTATGEAYGVEEK
jgi:hypothetical protein